MLQMVININAVMITIVIALLYGRKLHIMLLYRFLAVVKKLIVICLQAIYANEECVQVIK